MTSCRHADTAEGAPRPFAGPVARDENRASHGGYSASETCRTCLAQRPINCNGTHREEGPWDEAPSLAEIEREAIQERRAKGGLAPEQAKARYAAAVAELARRRKAVQP